MTGAIGHGFKLDVPIILLGEPVSMTGAIGHGFKPEYDPQLKENPVSMTGAIGHGFKLPLFQAIVKISCFGPFSVGIEVISCTGIRSLKASRFL
uniref:hypothetical protein n=1 Tax=Tistrella mobilis TaxID=171437 RepID=UPI003FD4A1A3